MPFFMVCTFLVLRNNGPIKHSDGPLLAKKPALFYS